MRIQKKSIILLLLCAMVPLVVISIASFVSARDALRAQIAGALQANSNESLRHLEEIFAEAILDLTAWSSAPTLQDVLIDDDAGEIGRLLKQSRKLYDHFSALVVLNDQGIAVAASNEDILSRDLARSNIFATAQAGDFYQGPVAVSELTNSQAIEFAMPIRADYDADTIIGVLIGAIDWAEVQAELSRFSVSGQQSDADHYLMLCAKASGRTLFAGKTPGAACGGASAGSLPTRQGVANVTFDQRGHLISTSESMGHDAFANPDWVMHSIVAESAAYASVNALAYRLGWIAVIVFFVVLWLGHWGSKSISYPITEIARIMRRLAQGDKQVRVPALDRIDEIGEMARSLDVFKTTAIEREIAESARDEARAQLIEALESISEGFELWDRESDRLVMCNSKYPEFFPALRHLLTPGVRFPELLEAAVEHRVYSTGGSHLAEFIEHKLIEHRNPEEPYELRLGDDRWVRVSKHQTQSGYIVGTWTDITERKQAEETIQRLALEDPLTGLANRNLFHRRLEDALAFARRYGSLVALMILDLDKFKTINDNHGHPAGDELLIEVARRLQSCVREVDTVARLGGDEFAVILTNFPDQNLVHNLAMRVIEELTRPVIVGGKALNTGTSIGIGIYPNDADNAQALIQKSDMALYQAKEAGRGTFRPFDESLHAQAQALNALERDLRLAVENQEFAVFYQPQIDLVRDRIVGAEALLRWEHGERGLISPADFIPLAETTGLIVPIGYWVLRQACQQIKSWQNAGPAPIRVAINISARQLEDADLVRQVKQAIGEFGIEARWLELEITEDMVIDDVEKAIDRLNQLHEIGVALAIDDFGTGYSSLSYLKQFPIDRLKIDQSFVRNLDEDPDNAAIVDAIIQLGRSMGLKTIAEGVETGKDAAHLLARKCDEAQGYYYSRPLRPEDFVTWWEERIRQEHENALSRKDEAKLRSGRPG